MDQMLLSHYCPWLLTVRQRFPLLKWPRRAAIEISHDEILHTIECATSVRELARAVNILQSHVWRATQQDASRLLTEALTRLQLHVLSTAPVSLRLEAARWLRFFVQSAMIKQPREIFITLVTAAVTTLPLELTPTSVQQETLHSYLLLLLDCCWPFRYPYPALDWDVFPEEEVFVPLAGLLGHPQITEEIRELLLTIFAILPTLHHPVLRETLGPIVQAWQGPRHTGVYQSVVKIRAHMECD